nr:hypothetical protein BJQ95_02389 [Cryobacterium sp. SO1]
MGVGRLGLDAALVEDGGRSERAHDHGAHGHLGGDERRDRPDALRHRGNERAGSEVGAVLVLGQDELVEVERVDDQVVSLTLRADAHQGGGVLDVVEVVFDGGRDQRLHAGTSEQPLEVDAGAVAVEELLIGAQGQVLEQRAVHLGDHIVEVLGHGVGELDGRAHLGDGLACDVVGVLDLRLRLTFGDGRDGALDGELVAVLERVAGEVAGPEQVLDGFRGAQVADDDPVDVADQLGADHGRADSLELRNLLVAVRLERGHVAVLDEVVTEALGLDVSVSSLLDPDRGDASDSRLGRCDASFTLTGRLDFGGHRFETGELGVRGLNSGGAELEDEGGGFGLECDEIKH